MLEYLYDNYGKINEDSKGKNIEKMKELYDVTTPIEFFFQRIQDYIDFASAARSLLTTKQILDSASLTVKQTGIFNTECWKWYKKPLVDKTWDHFCTFLKEAHNDFREDQDMTAQQSSQFNVNTINSAPPAQQDVTDAFKHLAAATAENFTAVVNLTTSNQALSDTLQERMSKL